MIALSHAVQSSHCRVKQLEFFGLEEGGDQLLPKSEVQLLQAVARNESLLLIEYGISNFSPEVFAALAHVLKHHTTLHMLFLPRPVDSVECVLQLVQAVKDCSAPFLELCLSTHTRSRASWVEVLKEHSLPRRRITLNFN